MTEQAEELVRFDNTLVVKFSGADCGSLAFECPDCKECVEIENGEGECSCRRWSAMMTAHGKQKRE